MGRQKATLPLTFLHIKSCEQSILTIQTHQISQLLFKSDGNSPPIDMKSHPAMSLSQTPLLLAQLHAIFSSMAPLISSVFANLAIPLAIIPTPIPISNTQLQSCTIKHCTIFEESSKSCALVPSIIQVPGPGLQCAVM